MYKISIHALCEEGDGQNLQSMSTNWIFLSTPSVKRATFTDRNAPNDSIISIHALCEEGDVSYFCLRETDSQISIHALCEEGDLSPADRFCVGYADFYPRPL